MDEWDEFYGALGGESPSVLGGTLQLEDVLQGAAVEGPLVPMRVWGGKEVPGCWCKGKQNQPSVMFGSERPHG